MKHHRHKSTSAAPVIEITAKEFHRHSKNQFWYIGIGLLLLALLYLTFSTRDYLMSAVVVAVGIAIFRLHNLTPGSKKVRLTTNGIQWGERFFGYHQLRSFWLANADDKVTVYLERLNFATPISFVVPVTRAESVIDYLTSYLPWHSHRFEPLSERLSRLLRI